ncbi:aldehyde dehydrogenase family protein [Alcaligenes endophyticus]|uniref:Aldehyde dehydrogenase family protein n=1 Tax=Alcaligenes endophyticus TaxID=1929088 RepID=A0ABT8EGY4_9BURK|nr:aldehyde dehydrogenase family protein [Alcaligenes endophyticus]MCX5589791.1 aldehyde dehydrogenase family protein [Alcaligenes endophyticus]MDN4120546.1 aldehyde dehydrogenase family protein [Alcaligenes endophyticus]
MELRNWLDGKSLGAESGQTWPVVDPSNGERYARLARSSEVDINWAVAAARRALSGPWGDMSSAARSQLLFRCARLLSDAREELARIESRDTGKPLKQAQADATALARYFEFYAGAVDKLHGQTIPISSSMTALTLREPLGVTAHIVPWNYPMQIFGRSVAASLAVGNCAVVKPAEDASLSILRVAEILHEAGLPAGVLNICTGLGAEAGAALAGHPDINHLSFTGSPVTGRVVAELAARNFVPVTLELGGKSPQIVFSDADLDAAIPAIMNGIIQNAGQTCSAGSRVLIQRAVYNDVIERLAEQFQALRVGPAIENLDCGPLISERQRDRVAAYLALAEKDGIRLVAQGRLLSTAPRGGYYQVPSLLADVPADHVLAQEEIFGPVLCAWSFSDEAEALRLANGTPYSLVAGIWTRDGARQLRLARRLRAGQVFINNYGAAGGVELPFGGSGESGIGREKGFEALYAFTGLKTLAIKHD